MCEKKRSTRTLFLFLLQLRHSLVVSARWRWTMAARFSYYSQMATALKCHNRRSCMTRLCPAAPAALPAIVHKSPPAWTIIYFSSVRRKPALPFNCTLQSITTLDLFLKKKNTLMDKPHNNNVRAEILYQFSLSLALFLCAACSDA